MKKITISNQNAMAVIGESLSIRPRYIMAAKEITVKNYR